MSASTENKEVAVTAPPTGAEPSLLNIIAAMAADPDADVGKLRALIDMQREVLAEQARREFEIAMNACQAELPTVVRDAQNDHTRSKYARLEAIDHRIRPIYTNHGFSLSFDGTTQADRTVEVTCIVSHRNGYTRAYKLAGEMDSSGAQGKANKTPIQAIGSTVSYLRRYLTCMIFNIVLTNEDNDGQRRSAAERIPTGNLSEMQLIELRWLMEQTNTQEDRLLEYARAPVMEEIPASKFAQLRGMLQQKQLKTKGAHHDRA